MSSNDGENLDELQHNNENEKACQTELSMHQICDMEVCIQNMTSELADLKQDLVQVELYEASFKENEEKTRFYTGLPSFFIVMKVFELCSPHIFSGCSNRLSKFQEFILVLMRLRLNIPFQDLAYRFGISRSTVSRVFDK